MDKQFKRIFIAVRIKPDDPFLSWYEEIRKILAGEEIRWSRTDNFHITLLFLGETDVKSIPGITAALHRSVVSQKPFGFSLAGIGVFRSLSYPKVFWVGLKNITELNQIKESIDFQLKSEINIDLNGSFKPHLTLGRMKRVNDIRLLKELISRYSDHNFMEVEVEEIILFESIPGKSGPVYKALETIAIPV